MHLNDFFEFDSIEPVLVNPKYSLLTVYFWHIFTFSCIFLIQKSFYKTPKLSGLRFLILAEIKQLYFQFFTTFLYSLKVLQRHY